jgi:hypothetical protein
MEKDSKSMEIHNAASLDTRQTWTCYEKQGTGNFWKEKLGPTQNNAQGRTQDI